ncbi:MAG: thioesterase family protein [Pseudomonadota bacterium]|nr:thioesterase family protein [Pseudomonadota bacterium]
MTVAPDRFATMMQFLFLQGTAPGEPIDLEVTRLQDGKRFSSRRVRGTQSGGRIVFEAQFSFAIPSFAPEHTTPNTAPESRPESLPSLIDLPVASRRGLGLLGSYSPDEKPCIDFRIPQIERQLSPDLSETSFRFWLKARQPLPANPRVHAAAFAYLSDWWLNFSSLGAHMSELDDERPLYISSLNHCVWFHRPFAADQWVHFHSESPCAAEGRGLSTARIHDLAGRLVASATQECLMAFA